MSIAGRGVGRAEGIGGRGRLGWRRIAAIGAVVLGIGVIAGGATLWRMHGAAPGDLDLATTRLSAGGLYRATIRSQAEPIPIGALHSWTIRIETPDGHPVPGATIAVDGGMPQHGHGLPTQPRVTRDLGNGEYLVEGMKFQMDGWWTLEFAIAADGGRDTTRFNLVLK
jgi:hypothetical protein